ncbi:MAG: MBL fold metallo-hydrolase [Puniceicoccales bacterium]|jgi:Cft2 family RNA processing exonuclease|nr:MBL fold metallo-hydrolase [Puniceicoccales bacterium]
MYFKDLNPECDIGANCHYVKIGLFNVVIDAGLSPKEMGSNALPNFSAIPPGSLDFVIVTHCHLDHIGAIPILMRAHPQARLLATPQSREIMPVLLENSYTVMKHQKKELGIKEYPLFELDEITRLNEHLFEMKYGMRRTFRKCDDSIDIEFFDAGHVSGASGIMLEYKHRKIFFTGDVLFRKQKILPGGQWPKEKVDTLIMETTRGATERTEQKQVALEIERLLTTVQHTLQMGGSVLIPTFAFGRVQEILTLLHEAVKAKKIDKKVPIICSGLGLAIIDTFDAIAKKYPSLNFRKSILRDLGVISLNRTKYLKPGNEPEKPTIFVVSSGMMVENTPSYNLAACLLGNSKNSICFVGYCDPDTPGGQLLRADKGSNFLFSAINYSAPVRANIERFDMSGHADRDELLQAAINLDPRTIVLTHGNEDSRNWFFDELISNAPHITVLIPEVMKEYNI